MTGLALVGVATTTLVVILVAPVRDSVVRSAPELESLPIHVAGGFPQPLATYLEKHVGLGAEDLRALQSGAPVTKLL